MLMAWADADGVPGALLERRNSQNLMARRGPDSMVNLTTARRFLRQGAGCSAWRTAALVNPPEGAVSSALGAVTPAPGAEAAIPRMAPRSEPRGPRRR